MSYKWTGVLVTLVLVPTMALANLLLDTLTDHEVPIIINLFAVAIAVVSTVVAFVAHIYQLTVAKINDINGTLGARLDQIEERFGDYNAGFVAGYTLGGGQDPSAVIHLAPRQAQPRTTPDGDH